MHIQAFNAAVSMTVPDTVTLGNCTVHTAWHGVTWDLILDPIIPPSCHSQTRGDLTGFSKSLAFLPWPPISPQPELLPPGT